MFTECPECGTGFRVSAKVLAQAGGRVRCGGCGNAFSALEHLTEELPAPDEQVSASTSEEDKFRETSRQLLQTLNDLAGSEDVVIEDTGLEWRVMDEDDEEVAPTEDAGESQESLALEDEAQDRPHDQTYDDNTPLSDDSDDAAENVTAVAAEEDEPAEDAEEADEEPAGPDLNEPEEWTGILEEVDEDDEMPLEVEEELAAIHNELSAKDDPVPVDLDAQFEMQAEAMGIDITGSQEIADEEGIAAEAGIDQREKDVAAEAAPTAEEDDQTGAGPLDEEEDEEVAAKAGTDHSEKDVAADAAPTDEDRESTGEFEEHIDVAANAFEDGEEEEKEIAAEAGTDQHEKEIAAEAAPTEEEEELSTEAALTAAQEKELDEMIQLSLAESAGDAADEIEASANDAAEEPELSLDGPETEPEHSTGDELPEQSEEEMTINQQIDQELLAAAAQDQDLKATIIGLEDPRDMFDEESADVETIIMEGDVVRGAMEREREKEKRERALARFDNAGNLIDSYAANRAVRGGRRSTDPAGFGMIAVTALLALLIGVQVVHAYREELSTYDLFNNTIGPIYRMLGNPVTPEWDIKGWQFESTNGSVAEGEDVLTISSRIGNRSEQPLPYPLVHVSLTDRWEEIIGSRILEPSEYLTGNLDPSRPVVPGDNFTAVITVNDPSVDATGFKVNVCYRDSPGRVRCATEDFKN
jgi:predicted Zn finger-like uncharacterized protein